MLPVAVASVVALIIAWAVIDLLARGQSTWVTGAGQLLAAVLTVGVSIRLIVILLQPSFDFPRALFYLFTLVWMCLAPLAQLSLHIVPIDLELSPERYETSIYLTVLGIVGYEAGVAIQRRRNARRAGRPQRAPWQLHVPALVWLTVIGLPVVFALVQRTGGLAILFTSRSDFSQTVFGEGASKASGAIVNSTILVVPFVVALGWVITLTSRRRTTGWEKGLATVAILVNFAVNNPLVQSRFWIATVYLALAGSWLTPRFREFPRVAVAVSLAFLVIVFPFSDVFRHADGPKTIKIEDPLAQLATKGDFDAFPQLTAAIRHDQLFGLRDGQQALGAIGFFVPRTYWPAKAEDTGTMLGKENTLGNVNLSAPLWAEGYVDFGWVGTFGYLLVLGMLSLSLNGLIRDSALGLGFSAFVGVYQFVLLRGSLLQAMGTTFVLLVLFRLILRRRSADDSEPPEPAG